MLYSTYIPCYQKVMPRKARIDAPGACHHITIRGIERKRIFRDEQDRGNFLGRLSRIVVDAETPCFAWSFLADHAHFLFKTGAVPITTVMRRLLTGYALSFNRKYRRRGQVFQNRYQSILCQEDPYLLELVRYIHLNPIRARLVRDMRELDTYPWAGHSVILGREKNDWQNSRYVLGLFASNRVQARRRYRSFVKKGIAQGKRPELSGGGLLRSAGNWSEIKASRKAGIPIKGDERILGDTEFVEQVLKAEKEKMDPKQVFQSKSVGFDGVVSRVGELLGMEIGKVLRPGKQPKRVKARSLVCFWAQRELGMTTVEIAGRVGVCQSAVSRSSLRGEKIAEENQWMLGKHEKTPSKR